MSYEQDEQKYLDAQRRNDDARLDMAGRAKRVLDRYGDTGLRLLAQTAHKRFATLRQEAEVAPLLPLLEDKPTLTFNHLAVVRREADPVPWLEVAADENLSPADLRRRIATSRRQVTSPEKVLARAGAVSEKMKSIADEAAEAGVLREVAERAESAAQYAKAKLGSD